jgi:o-aminophenol oxidase
VTRARAAPLVPLVDGLPLPSRLIAAEHDGRLTVRIRAALHQFHRDLPVSSVWGFDGMIPGPTIDAERRHPVTVEWRNELEGAFPVAVTVAPEATDADGASVQCVPRFRTATSTSTSRGG